MATDSVVRLEFCSHFDMLDFVQVVSDEMGRLVGLDSDSTHWVREAGARVGHQRHQTRQPGR